MLKVEHWSGADDSLVVSHFSTVGTRREQYKDELFQVLTTTFMQKGIVGAQTCAMA